MKHKKLIGLLILLLIYAASAVIGGLVFYLLKDYMNYLVAILIADVVATIVVWACGIICKTPSVYDPYWSVQTVIIYTALLFYFNNWNLFTIVPLVAMALYSIRLTTNFIIGFHGLDYVDWRYAMLREKSGRLFQVVNLMGICMFPTLVVYLASVPLFVYATLPFESFTYFDLIGSGVIALGVFFELISDIQMKSFIRNRTSREEVINIGMWKYSRHPNYLGEIIIWFGVALVLLPVHYSYWYWATGAFVNLLMFLFISIPMEEKHMLEYKPSLKDYINTTSCLLLLPRKKQRKDENVSETN